MGERLRREGLVHHGIELRFNRQRHRIDMHELTGGRAITVYAQHEVVKDLIAGAAADGGQILFEASHVSVHDFDGASHAFASSAMAKMHEIVCDFIGGCDGFHGICRPSIPAGRCAFTRRCIRSAGWAFSLKRLRRRRSSFIRTTNAASRSSACAHP